MSNANDTAVHVRRSSNPKVFAEAEIPVDQDGCVRVAIFRNPEGGYGFARDGDYEIHVNGLRVRCGKKALAEVPDNLKAEAVRQLVTLVKGESGEKHPTAEA